MDRSPCLGVFRWCTSFIVLLHHSSAAKSFFSKPGSDSSNFQKKFPFSSNICLHIPVTRMSFPTIWKLFKHFCQSYKINNFFHLGKESAQFYKTIVLSRYTFCVDVFTKYNFFTRFCLHFLPDLFINSTN